MQKKTEIPDDVLDFIARRMDSVPHLEALLLLCEDPAITWTEEDVSKRVYVSLERSRTILQDLARHGLISRSTEHTNQYCYEPRWDEAQIMPKVAATYRRHLIYVSRYIHAKANSGAVQEFARAFKFNQED